MQFIYLCMNVNELYAVRQLNKVEVDKYGAVLWFLLGIVCPIYVAEIFKLLIWGAENWLIKYIYKIMIGSDLHKRTWMQWRLNIYLTSHLDSWNDFRCC